MVSASGSLLSEVTQAASNCMMEKTATEYTQAMHCIHVMARVATITCMVRGGCNCMEWGVGYMRRTGSNGE